MIMSPRHALFSCPVQRRERERELPGAPEGVAKATIGMPVSLRPDQVRPDQTRPDLPLKNYFATLLAFTACLMAPKENITANDGHRE